MRPRSTIVILFGVSGCGKSTLGRLLAHRLSCSFEDADDYHDKRCKERMRAAIPLTDEDRNPWLRRLNAMLLDYERRKLSCVLACSALKQSYRKTIAQGLANIIAIHIDVPETIIRERLHARAHEYMNPSLLQSQFEILETDRETLSIDGTLEPHQAVERIMALIES